jgi:hypothetical protein
MLNFSLKFYRSGKRNYFTTERNLCEDKDFARLKKFAKIMK